MSLPSMEYLLECSTSTLHELELSSLDRSAQALKRAKLEMEEAVAQREAAGVARYFIEHRGELLEAARRTLEAEPVLPFRKSA